MKHPLLLLVFILLLSAGLRAAFAHTISAPAYVQANQAGEFQYQFTVTIGPDAEEVSFIGANARNNIRVGSSLYEYECLPLGPGETVTLDVTGDLEDDWRMGRMVNWVTFCDDSTLSDTTFVLPYNPTPSVPVTWGHIKALYGR